MQRSNLIATQAWLTFRSKAIFARAALDERFPYCLLIPTGLEAFMHEK
jgi:hypothetical protein